MTIRASAIKALQIFKDRASADYRVPLGEIRGSTGLVTTATLADSVWAWVISASVAVLSSNTADGATKTANGHFQWRVPDSWHPSQTLNARVHVKLNSVTGTGVANNGSDIDMTCFKQVDGAVGSDLCLTAAATFAALATWYDKDFTIDMTGVRAGDLLNFTVVGRAIESDAGNGTLAVHVESITLQPSDPS